VCPGKTAFGLPCTHAGSVKNGAPSDCIAAASREGECAVLIFSRFRNSFSASWRPACVGTALTLSLATLAYAESADTLYVLGCVGAPGTVGCVLRAGPAGDPYIRSVPQPASDAEKARASERDHKWLERCKPIVVQDRYGVPRYHYAVAGCGFGIIE
jgi:hypothetical protein